MAFAKKHQSMSKAAKEGSCASQADMDFFEEEKKRNNAYQRWWRAQRKKENENALKELKNDPDSKILESLSKSQKLAIMRKASNEGSMIPEDISKAEVIKECSDVPKADIDKEILSNIADFNLLNKEAESKNEHVSQ